jgi:predicted HTH domain antitoxin
MKTITIEVPDQLPPELDGSNEDLAREFRLAAAIFWYDHGLISQGKGAEIAGLTRSEFIDALSAARVDVLQVTPEGLRTELERTLDARR